MPAALIVSDFPIIAATASQVFEGRYEVTSQSWATYMGDPVCAADIVIADSTTLPVEPILRLLQRTHPEARVIVCSLHHNEVQIYRTRAGDLVMEEALPSLLAVTG